MRRIGNPHLEASSATRARTSLGAALSLALMAAVAGGSAASRAEGCSQDLIAGVIDQTGAELRKLSAAHQPAYQAKLRRLADAQHVGRLLAVSRGDF